MLVCPLAPSPNAALTAVRDGAKLNIIGTIDQQTRGRLGARCAAAPCPTPQDKALTAEVGTAELFGEAVDSKSTDAYLANLRLRRIGSSRIARSTHTVRRLADRRARRLCVPDVQSHRHNVGL